MSTKPREQPDLLPCYMYSPPRFAHEMEDPDDIGDNVEKLFLSGVDKAAADISQ